MKDINVKFALSYILKNQDTITIDKLVKVLAMSKDKVLQILNKLKSAKLIDITNELVPLISSNEYNALVESKEL